MLSTSPSVPQTMLFALTVVVPQTMLSLRRGRIDAVAPHDVGAPDDVVALVIGDVPQTMLVPHTMLVPQTMLSPSS